VPSLVAADTPKSRGRFSVSWRRLEFFLLAAGAVVLAWLALSKAADASLKDRVDAAKQDADALSAKIGATSDRIAALSSQAEQARHRITELTAELRTGEARSTQLAAEVAAAERELEASRARLKRAQGVLANRLVAIYKNGEPSYVDLVLSAHGFDDLTTQLDYLRAIEDADAGAADRVRALKDQVKAEYDHLGELKTSVDQHNRELVSARAEVARARAAIKRQSAELDAAKGEEQSALSQIREKITELTAEIGARRTSALFGDGNWAIPTYIVMCESGGNYRAVNPSSGAGGAYQIMPATWAAHGGQGRPQDAPPAEQDRIAAEIWADSGPGAWSCA
jgi:peptidoglycan hydrolase CwlO-like protein